MFPSKWSYFVLLSSLVFSYGFVLLSVVPSIHGGGGGLEVRVAFNGWVCIGVRDAILAQNIHCTKLNPEPDAHSGSQVHKALVAWDPWSTLEYYLATEM